MTEGVDPRYRDFESWPLEQRVRALVEANERAMRAVLEAVPELFRAAAGIAERLSAGGRLVYAGAGTSGRLALQDAAELPPTFDFDRTLVLLAGGAGASSSAREGAEDDTEAAVRAVDEAEVGPGDAFVALAASGRTPYAVAAARRARERGAFTVGIANNPGTPLVTDTDVGVVLDTGPEVVAGSTRMVAGTAQKIALNALSSAPMVELGALYGNLMVAMRPTNAKLHQRAIDMVATATGASRDSAEQAFLACGGDIRSAIVHLLTGASPEAALEALRRHGGRVSHVLAERVGADQHR